MYLYTATIKRKKKIQFCRFKVRMFFNLFLKEYTIIRYEDIFQSQQSYCPKNIYVWRLPNFKLKINKIEVENVVLL